MRTVLAVDGGNSKTDVVIANDVGQLLARVRGPGCSPDALGVVGGINVLRPLIVEARQQAGLAAGSPADVAALLLAGVDRPEQEDDFAAALQPLGLGREIVVSNDTFAVLLAGSPHGWGIAVVCGAGINAVGVTSDGKVARYQALGDLSGDWGGGYAVGLAALGAAIRGEDGRGPRTALTQQLCAQFKVAVPQDIAAAIHERRLDDQILVGLAPLVFDCASDGDEVARTIVERLGDEVATMTVALLRRLDLRDDAVDVVLGGGLLQGGHVELVSQIERQVKAAAAGSVVSVLDVPPVVGSARAGLQRLTMGSDDIESALRRLSTDLAGGP